MKLRPCPNNPSHKLVHLMRYDAYMCPECDVWTEPDCECDAADCTFKAANRPERPSQAKP
jgi:hypothetical protein